MRTCELVVELRDPMGSIRRWDNDLLLITWVKETGG